MKDTKFSMILIDKLKNKRRDKNLNKMGFKVLMKKKKKMMMRLINN